ncbi:AraC family transcriptional regulator [Halioxenophilus aromaticivorans]|uniref:AraC family transcriptional regulator n=1 Tax=Halioxenophilus aromaticivorans TaxID=1306992 RepID=A0AAV3TX09_9ALTE
MHPHHHSISIHFAHCLISKAQECGLDTQHLLSHAGLSPALLENRELRITPEQLSRLLLELWRIGDDEFMGMSSHTVRFGVFGLLARQLVHCANLKEVYRYCSRFYNLVTPAIDVEFTVHNNQATFALALNEPEKDNLGMLRELFLLIWHRFPSWFVGQRVPLQQVTLKLAKPQHFAEHRLMYPAPVHYEHSRDSIVFDAAFLDLPVVQTSATLLEYLPQLPLEWFKRQAYYPVFTRRVKDYLETNAEFVGVNMEDMANQLQMTSRTLRRKLTEEGTSFQLLKDEMRRDTAIHYLSQPNQPISQIATLLGFSEPAAFARAFKQWTGVPPSVYRSGPKR